MDVTEPSGPLDLTPRDVAPRRRGRRRVVGVAVAVAVVGAIVAVLWNGLSEATVFFYNVDDAVAKRDELGDKRFRMQGNVLEDSIERTDGGVEFLLAFGGESVAVRHTGEPPELFGATIPIVVEGRFVDEGDAEVFRSDRILIRHDNTYEEENPGRLRDAERDAAEEPPAP